MCQEFYFYLWPKHVAVTTVYNIENVVLTDYFLVFNVEKNTKGINRLNINIFKFNKSLFHSSPKNLN